MKQVEVKTFDGKELAELLKACDPRLFEYIQALRDNARRWQEIAQAAIEKVKKIDKKFPELEALTKELEKTGWLTQEDKDLPLVKHQYIGVGVVLNAIKRLMGKE